MACCDSLVREYVESDHFLVHIQAVGHKLFPLPCPDCKHGIERLDWVYFAVGFLEDADHQHHPIHRQVAFGALLSQALTLA